MMILMTQLQDNHTDSQPVKLLYVCHIVIKRRQQLHQALYHIYRVSLENGILWKTFKLIKNSKVGGVLENSGYLLQYSIRSIICKAFCHHVIIVTVSSSIFNIDMDKLTDKHTTLGLTGLLRRQIWAL